MRGCPGDTTSPAIGYARSKTFRTPMSASSARNVHAADVRQSVSAEHLSRAIEGSVWPTQFALTRMRHGAVAGARSSAAVPRYFDVL